MRRIRTLKSASLLEFGLRSNRLTSCSESFAGLLATGRLTSQAINATIEIADVKEPMPTLSACSSVFQLAAGLNLVAAAIIADFDRAKEQITGLYLRKVQEFIDDFRVVEKVRSETVDYIFRFVPALRFARFLTVLLTLWSFAATGVSLFALYAASMEPNSYITVKMFNWFFSTTLILSPCLYLFGGLFWRSILSLINNRALPDKKKALEFADSIQRHSEVRQQLREADQILEHATTQIIELQWRHRIESIVSACRRFLNRLRH